MKWLGRKSKTGLWALVAALGCGGHAGDGSQLGGETNWLATCNADSDCSVGQCLCGVCTISCAESNACSDGPAESSCVAQSELPSSCGQQLSAGPLTTGLCLVSDTQVGGPLSSTELPAPATPLDATLALFLRDLEAQPAEAQRFTRYFSIAHLAPFVLEEDGQSVRAPLAIERGRWGLAKLVNSLSSVPVATAPVSIDSEGLFYRIDLRAYGWERPIAVDGVSYRDGWEAIVARASLAVEYGGPTADALAQRSGSTSTWLFGDDFIATAATGNLYYALLGLPATLGELQSRLAQDQPTAPVLQRAAIDASSYSTNARVVERRVFPDGKMYWQAFNFSTAARGSAVFDTPYDFVADATEVIFPLPNGLNGFFMADEQGERLLTSQLSREAVLDPTQRDGVVRNGVSCFGCHNSGFVSFSENMPEGWSPAAMISAEAPEQVLVAYPSATKLNRSLAADNVAYVAAAERAGVEPKRPDGVSRLYLDFFLGDVTQSRAADELFTSPQALQAAVLRLPGALFPLIGAERWVTREQFAGAYRDAMCTLHPTALNQPVGCR